MKKSVIDSHEFILQEYYHLQRKVGKGAYGVVCQAVDLRNSRAVAIKKTQNPFLDLGLARRSIREIKLLSKFNHENIVKVLDIGRPASPHNAEHIVSVLEFMPSDLHKTIAGGNVLSIHHVRYFMWQILRAVKYLHSASVMHRDLKPDNILIDSECVIKLCDLGLGRGFSPNGCDPTVYVVTRYYRAPEIMTNPAGYSFPIDIWSCGCVFGELLRRKPLFPGKTPVEMINMILGLIGKPTADEIAQVKDEVARRFLERMPDIAKKDFSRVFPGASPEAIDLLDRMLQFSPENRPTAKECLEHPFFAELHDESSEPVAEN